MNWQAISSNPFFTVALPIVITLVVTMVTQNKRIDDLRDAMNKRFDAVNQRFDGVDRRFDSMDRRLDNMDRRLDNMDRRLEGIESKLGEQGARIARLEGPALVRG